MYLRKYIEINEYPCISEKGTPFIKKRKSTNCVFLCDKCGVEFERKLGLTSKNRNSKEYKHFCETCKDPALFAKMGHKKKEETLARRVGEKRIDSNGYIVVRVSRDHKGSGIYGGAVREHLLVMEQHLGRKLEKGEVVHHIDGNKQNNNIDNLDLCTVKEHNKCHATSEEIIFDLYKKGVVKYDRITKRYTLNS